MVLRGGAILMVEGRFGGGVQINPVTVSPLQRRRIGLLGQAGLWLERQCVLAYTGLFFK